jgi:hypothetical protein
LDFPGAHTFRFWEYCRGWVYHCHSGNCFCYFACLGHGECSGYVSWTESGCRSSGKGRKISVENRQAVL